MHFTFVFMTYFELFVCSMSYGLQFIVLNVNRRFATTSLKILFLSLLSCLHTLVKNKPHTSMAISECSVLFHWLYNYSSDAIINETSKFVFLILLLSYSTFHFLLTLNSIILLNLVISSRKLYDSLGIFSINSYDIKKTKC